MRSHILSFLLLFPFCCYAQDVDSTFSVTYVESARASLPTSLISNVQSTGIPIDSLKSRQGKFIALIYDDYYLTEGIIRSVYQAMCLWEDCMSITNPIVFDLLFDEEMENQDEMITVVNYGKDMINRICIPQSLMSQRSLGGSSSDGQITVNANIDWDASWGYESPYGIDRFTTAMLRHIAHLLGFGSSVGYRGDNLRFLGVLPTAFDQMILDDEDNLLSLSTNIGNFLSRDIYLQVGNNKYPLFSSGQGYISYRTANFFSIGEEAIMEYPYINVESLLCIDSIVLEVLEAIGWTITDDKKRVITGTNLDIDGYGSYYSIHTFGIHPDGATVNRWVLQLFDNNTHQYQDVEVGYGQSFCPVNYTITDSYLDDFNCIQARIRCTLTDSEGTRTYNYPLFLELAPWLDSYEISNVVYHSTSNTYDLDFLIHQNGAALIRLYVGNDYSMSQSYLMPVSNPSTLHIANVPTAGNSYLDLTMENSYGTSFKYIPLDLSNNNSHQGTYSDYQGVTLDRHKVRYDSNTRHSVIKRIKRRDYDRKTYMRFTY